MLAWILPACSPHDTEPPVDASSVVATVSEAVSTVVEVTYAPADAEGLSVEFLGRSVPAHGGRAVLAGIPADTTFTFRFVSEDFVGPEHTATTGALPSGLPAVELRDDGDPPAAFVATSWLKTQDEGSAAMVLDAQGRIVWYDVLEGVGTTPVLKRLGDDFVYLVTSHSYLPTSRVVIVSTDGRTREEIPLPYAHHDVLPVPHARFAAIVGEPREIDGQAVMGEQLVEVYDDGSQRVVWNAFDWIEVVENDGWGATAYPEGADWLHVNGLFYEPAEDVYYVSSYRLRCVWKIARQTGEILWTFDGSAGEGDFALTNDDGFGVQHAPEWSDGGLLFFDNGYEAGRSRLVRYTMDPTDGTAERTWEWPHPDALYAVVLGDVDALAGGRHLSAWSTHGEIVLTEADGTIGWRVDVEPTYVVAQVEAFDAF